MSLYQAAQRLIGLEAGGDDFPFFQEAARSHFALSLLPVWPEGLSDLDEWDRNHLFLLELNGQFEGEFTLEEGASQAQFTPAKDLPKALLDMRGDGPWLLYALGEPKQGQKLLRAFLSCPLLYPCHLNHGFLSLQAHQLGKLEEFHFHRELPPQFPEEGQILKGQSKGDQAERFLEVLEKEQSDLLNLVEVAGLSSSGGLGKLRFQERGLLQGEGLRLKEFLDQATAMQEFHRERLSHRMSRLCRWEKTPKGLQCEGGPIEYHLSRALARPENILRPLTNGSNPLHLLGSFQRLGRDQWLAQFVDLKNAWQMEMELTPQVLRLFPSDSGGLALIEKLEAYFAKLMIGWRLHV